MVSWLQKIYSGNESHAEGQNDEMTVPNCRYRDRMIIYALTECLWLSIVAE